MHNSTVVFDTNNTTKTKSYKIIIHTMLKNLFKHYITKNYM